MYDLKIRVFNGFKDLQQILKSQRFRCYVIATTHSYCLEYGINMWTWTMAMDTSLMDNYYKSLIKRHAKQSLFLENVFALNFRYWEVQLVFFDNRKTKPFGNRSRHDAG